MCTIAWPLQARPSLELKTRPRFRPGSLSLSMIRAMLRTFSWQALQAKAISVRMLQLLDGARSPLKYVII
jgi:hypothetical protein